MRTRLHTGTTTADKIIPHWFREFLTYELSVGVQSGGDRSDQRGSGCKDSGAGVREDQGGISESGPEVRAVKKVYIITQVVYDQKV